MRYSNIIAASLTAPLVAAHGMEGAPSVFGLPKQLRASNPLAGLQARHAADPIRAMGPRQAAGPERCGPENGNQVCAETECCSAAGYCGTTQAHCQAPDCLFKFGPACDTNKTPRGASTRQDPRPQLGSISYGGAGIYVCNNPGTVAITYDDGPYIYTQGVMEQFEARGWHATFFLTGNNIGKGAIDENWAGVIQRMYDNGHQVASHTWSHEDLSVITREEVYDQMVKNEMAIRNILGKYPTYMRPPYSSCNAACQSVMTDLGYVVSYFDLDTSDYLNLTPELIQNSKDKFKAGIDTRSVPPFDGDRLVIGHDIHQLTAENLTAYMLNYIASEGLRGVTMGECLNDPKENWYRDSTPAGPAPPSTSSSTSSGPIPTPTGPTSTDGTCGSDNQGQSCIGFVGNDGALGECCSQYGYCGRTSDHCQTGCQAGFGKCGAQPSAAPSASSSAVVTTSSATGPVPTPTGPPTTDGSCGTSNSGMTCIGFVGPAGLSECCSEYGYCGNTDTYCAAGCQAGFGKCGAQDLSSSSVAVSASSSVAASASSSVAASASSSVAASASSSVAASASSSVAASASSSVAASASSSVAISASSSVAVSASSSVAVSSASSTADVSSTVDASSTIAAPSSTPTTSGETSRDGSCGGQAGFTCVNFATLEGEKAECCSAWGWCGNSADHCGSSCNPVYGNCPGSASSSAFLSSSSAVSTSEVSEATSSVAVTSDKPEATSSDPVSISVSSGIVSSDKPEATTSDLVSVPASSAVVSSDKPEATTSDVEYPSTSTDAESVSSHFSHSTLSETAPAATFTAEYSASTFIATVSKDAYPTGSVPAVSEGVSSSSIDAEYPASTPDVSEAIPSSTEGVEYPAESSAIVSIPGADQTSAYPVSSPASTPVYPASSFATAVKPTSTSYTTSTVVPTSTALPVSQNGKCGEHNGGQTCAGYKSPWGLRMGCCCKQTGRCSVDPWACGVGCDKKYGKCWY